VAVNEAGFVTGHSAKLWGQFFSNKGRDIMSLKITRSNRNVFGDLGLDVEEAEHLKIRADLMIQVQKQIEAAGYKQANAAKILGILNLG
jgi:hypothetical protein